MTITMTFAQPALRVGAGLGRAAEAAVARFRYAMRLRETRRYLEQMDEHMLQDIGVSRAQALFDLDQRTPHG